MEEQNLELLGIENFIGTEHYFNGYMGVKYTDGVYYISQNGYSWLVTDCIAVIKTNSKISREAFLSIKLKVNEDKTAVMTIDDGNNNILYTQEYNYTDAKRDLNLYFMNDVLMLNSEY